MTTESKLKTLMEYEGFDDETEFMEAFALESVVPGICMTEGCDYSAHYEPDQDAGWCEVCDAGTVKSCLMLMGIL